MAAHVTDKLDGLPRKAVAVKADLMAKADRKALAEDWKRLQGNAIARAIALADLTPKGVSEEMGYVNEDGTINQAPLSRWIAGTENPHFAKLFAIDALRWWLVVCLAKLAEAEIVTTIRRPA